MSVWENFLRRYQCAQYGIKLHTKFLNASTDFKAHKQILGIMLFYSKIKYFLSNIKTLSIETFKIRILSARSEKLSLN